MTHRPNDQKDQKDSIDNVEITESELSYYVVDEPYMVSQDQLKRSYLNNLNLEEFRHEQSERCSNLFIEGLGSVSVVLDKNTWKADNVFVNGFHMPYELIVNRMRKSEMTVQKPKKSEPRTLFSEWVPIATYICSNYYEQKEQKEQADKQEKEPACSVIGAKISKSLVRNAISRIFADPAQSIMEPISNSIDAINAKNGKNTKIGKFGMGFFSFLFWLIGNPNAMITIKTTSLSDEGLLIHLHIEFQEIDGIVKFRYRYAGSNRVDTGTIMELSGITEATASSFTPYISRYFYSKTKVTHNIGRAVQTHAGDYYNIMLEGDIHSNYEWTTDVVTVIKKTESKSESKSESEYNTSIIVQDHGLGISPDVLFNTLLVPSSSSKTLQLEENVHPDEIREDIYISNVHTIYDQFEKLHISVGTNVIVSIDYGEGYSIDCVNKRNGDGNLDEQILGKCITLALPRNIRIPVARNDVIVTAESEVIPSMEILANRMIVLHQTLIPLENGIKKYSKFTSRSVNRDIFQSSLRYIKTELNKTYYSVSALNREFIDIIEKQIRVAGHDVLYYTSIDGSSHLLEKKIADILGYSEVYLGKYTCIVDFVRNVTTAGTNSLLFIPSKLARSKSNWRSTVKMMLVTERLVINPKWKKEDSYRKNKQSEPIGGESRQKKRLVKMINNVRNRLDNLTQYYQVILNEPNIILQADLIPIDNRDLHLEMLETYYSVLGSYYKPAFTFAYGAGLKILSGQNRFVFQEMPAEFVPWFNSLFEHDDGRDILSQLVSYYKFEATNNSFPSPTAMINPASLILIGMYPLVHLNKTDPDRLYLTIKPVLARLARTCQDSRYFFSIILVVNQIQHLVPIRKFARFIRLLYNTFQKELGYEELNSILLHYAFNYQPKKLISLAKDILKTMKGKKLINYTRPTAYKKDLSVTLSAVVSSVFQKDYETDRLIETIKQIKREKAPNIPLQMVEIAINEGSVRDVLVSTFFELYQNSLDALKEKDHNALMGSEISVTLNEIRNPDTDQVSLVMKFSDTVGIAEKHIMALMIPYYSSKSGLGASTGEMGNGFFNTYRSADYVCVQTRKDDFSLTITDIPIVDDSGRVVDLQKYFNVKGPDKPGNGTEVTIIFKETDQTKLLYDISTLKDLMFNVLSLHNTRIPLPIISLMGEKDKRGIGVETITVENNDIFSTILSSGRGNNDVSYVFTNGVPFLPLRDFVEKVLKKKIHRSINLSGNCYLNLKKGSYNPVQSRDILTFNNDEDQEVTDQIYKAVTDLYFVHIMINGHGNGKKNSVYVKSVFNPQMKDSNYMRSVCLWDFNFAFSYNFYIQVKIKGMIRKFYNIHHLVNYIIDEKHSASYVTENYKGLRQVDNAIRNLVVKELTDEENRNINRGLKKAKKGSGEIVDKTLSLAIEVACNAFIQVYWLKASDLGIPGFVGMKIPQLVVNIEQYGQFSAFYSGHNHQITLSFSPIFAHEKFEQLFVNFLGLLYTNNHDGLENDPVYKEMFGFRADNILSHEMEHARRRTSHASTAGHGEIKNFFPTPPLFDGKSLKYNECHAMVHGLVLKDSVFIDDFSKTLNYLVEEYVDKFPQVSKYF
jgi:hypothetical protein